MRKHLKTVWNFNTDIQLAETEYEEGEDEPNEDEVYDMFADLDLSQNVQDQFHFAEHYSCDEDAVLDNSGGRTRKCYAFEVMTKEKTTNSKKRWDKINSKEGVEPTYIIKSW